MINVRLIYEDQTTWYAGQFATDEAADVWIEEEKSRSYWKETTIVEKEFIPDPPPLEQPIEE